jgi:hypothetical protein
VFQTRNVAVWRPFISLHRVEAFGVFRTIRLSS